jgi:dTDP-D-glucose 4,6-dehydratase
MEWFNIVKQPDMTTLEMNEMVARTKMINEFLPRQENSFISYIHDRLGNDKKYLTKLVKRYNESIPKESDLEEIKLPNKYQMIEMPNNKYVSKYDKTTYHRSDSIQSYNVMVNRIAKYNLRVISFKKFITDKEMQRKVGLI